MLKPLLIASALTLTMAAVYAQNVPTATCKGCPASYISNDELQAYLKRAIARNQIDVLDHDHRWLQKAGEIHVLGKQCDLGRRNDERGVTGQVARQIANGMCLARSGRPVKQDTLAGRLTPCAQLRAAPHKVQDVAVEQLPWPPTG